MNNNDLISIIVCIYNGEKYLKKCVDSIINQDYKNIEIILIEDGSPDSSGEIIDNYAKIDKRIRVIHQKNMGVSLSRNKGLDLSNGKYICIIDQDDWIEKNYVSYLLKLNYEFNSQISITPKVIISTTNSNSYKEQSKADYVYTGEEAACDMLYSKIDIGPWNKMISKDLIEKNNIRFHNELFGGEGLDFSVECFMKAKNVAVGLHGIYHYRIDNYTSEMSSFKLRTALSSFNAVKILKNEFKNSSIKLKNALNFSMWNNYNFYFCSMINNNDTKENREYYLKWKTYLKKNKSILFQSPLSFTTKIKKYLVVISPNLYKLALRLRNTLKKNYGRNFK